MSRIAVSKAKNRRRRQVVLPQSKRMMSFSEQLNTTNTGSISHLAEMWKRPFLSWKAVYAILHGEIFDQVFKFTHTLIQQEIGMSTLSKYHFIIEYLTSH